MRLLELQNIPILEQLRLEEALLRVSSESWCILNTGSPAAIVMGISGKAEKLVDLKKIKEDNIPLIKRFSGGGTVYVDSQTVFATIISNHSSFDFPAQPKPILEWSETFYKPLFKDFGLRENDYVFGEKKFGGNAQYIQKGRWLLHTSFLWDYSPEKMNYLLMPEKKPQYRGERSHNDFLCSLKSLFPQKEELLTRLSTHMQEIFQAKKTTLEEALHILEIPHRKSTELLTP